MRTIIKTEHPEHGLHYWSYDSDDQEGMGPEFIKAFPVGGGFAKRIPREDVKDWDAKIPSAHKRMFVGFPDFPEYGLISCYVNPHDNWNGWAKPMVDADGLALFLAQQSRFAAENPEAGYATGKMDGDAVIWHDPNYTEDGDLTIVPEWIDVDGAPVLGIKVWDISLGFTWDTFTTEEAEQFRKAVHHD